VQTSGIEAFLKSNTLLAAGNFRYALDYLRDFEDAYAIIPYPKFDDQQAEYYSMLDGYHAVIGVPMTSQNTELAGLITEAMTAESWKEVVPAYYDVALKTKGVRDEESIAMMDLIMDSVKVDFTYIYDNWQGYAFTIQTLLQNKNKNFASEVKKKEKPVQRWYDKVVAAFLEYGQA